MYPCADLFIEVEAQGVGGWARGEEAHSGGGGARGEEALRSGVGREDSKRWLLGLG